MPVAELTATYAWIRGALTVWPRLRWSEVHTSNILLYANSLRHAGGLPPIPGTSTSPEFDAFWRSRQSRIRTKCRLAVDAWRAAGSPGWEHAFDQEFDRLYRRENAEKIAAAERRAGQLWQLFK